jgi:hypothetical protein
MQLSMSSTPVCLPANFGRAHLTDSTPEGQGSQGVLARPSKQILEAIFGTSREEEVVTKILREGKLITSGNPERSATTNDSQCVGVYPGALRSRSYLECAGRVRTRSPWGRARAASAAVVERSSSLRREVALACPARATKSITVHPFERDSLHAECKLITSRPMYRPAPEVWAQCWRQTPYRRADEASQ